MHYLDNGTGYTRGTVISMEPKVICYGRGGNIHLMVHAQKVADVVIPGDTLEIDYGHENPVKYRVLGAELSPRTGIMTRCELVFD